MNLILLQEAKFRLLYYNDGMHTSNLHQPLAVVVQCLTPNAVYIHSGEGVDKTSGWWSKSEIFQGAPMDSSEIVSASASFEKLMRIATAKQR